MKNHQKPRLFVPTQEDLDRVGKELAKNLSSNVKVMAGENEFIGQKEITSSQDWLEMDLKSQSGSIWTKKASGMQKKKIKNYPEQNSKPTLLTQVEPKYGNSSDILKVLIIFFGVFLSAQTSLNAQVHVSSIRNTHSELIVNDSIYLKKGDSIQVYLPAGKDFVFIKQKKNALNAKMLGKVANVVGTGASVVGIGTGNLKVLRGANQVLQKARVVEYGADAIDKVQNLPISNEAKKIAGKQAEIESWEFTNDGYVLSVLLEKKKYEIYLQEAVMAGEVKLK